MGNGFETGGEFDQSGLTPRTPEDLEADGQPVGSEAARDDESREAADWAEQVGIVLAFRIARGTDF